MRSKRIVLLIAAGVAVVGAIAFAIVAVRPGDDESSDSYSGKSNGVRVTFEIVNDSRSYETTTLAEEGREFLGGSRVSYAVFHQDVKGGDPALRIERVEAETSEGRIITYENLSGLVSDWRLAQTLDQIGQGSAVALAKIDSAAREAAPDDTFLYASERPGSVKFVTVYPHESEPFVLSRES